MKNRTRGEAGVRSDDLFGLFFCKERIDGVINVVIVKPFCIVQYPFFGKTESIRNCLALDIAGRNSDDNPIEAVFLKSLFYQCSAAISHDPFSFGIL